MDDGARGLRGAIMGLALWWNLRRLHSDQPLVRAKAIARLGNLGQAAAIGSLGDALRDTEPSLRTAAAQALGALGHADAVGPLVSTLLAEKHWDVRYEVVRALRKIGDPQAVNELLVILDDRNASIGLQQVTTWALKEFGWEHLTPAQQAGVLILREEWSEVRKLGAEAVGPVLTVLRDGTPRMRQEAATTLAHIGGERALVGLLESLASADRDLRRVAAGALDKGASALSPEQSARVAIVLGRWSAIPRLGEAAGVALAKAIRGGDSETAPRAAQALGEIGGSRARQTLSEALRHKLPNVREAAAKGLARCGDAASLPTLQAALDDADPRVREAAANALTTLGWSPQDPSEQVHLALAAGSAASLVMMGTRAIAPLIENLARPMMRHLAAETLARIGEPATANLVRSLRDDRVALRVAVAETLGRIASKTSVAALEQAFDDPELDARKAAHDALLKAGWQPADEGQSVQVAIALEKWADVVEFGPLAMDLLLKRVDDPRRAPAILRTLDKILQGPSARNLSLVHLQAVAHLATTNAPGNVRPGAASPAALKTTVARRRIAQLARHELKRRRQPA